MRRLSAFLLAANFLYLVALPSIAGRILSLVGCVIALALIVGPLVSKRLAARVFAEPVADSRSAFVPIVLAFTLPALSLFAQRAPALLRIDAALLVIAAWLISLTWLLAAPRRPSSTPAVVAPEGASRALPLLTLLFIVWTSFFWLALVWKVGVAHVALSLAREDRLTLSFQLWETRPPSEHLFLVWLSRDHFLRHDAYTNHLHPYTLLFYGWTKTVQFATGQPPYVGRNLSPFAMAAVGILAFSMLLSRLRLSARPAGLKFHGTLFLGLGFLISEWHYWDYLYLINFDSLFPLIAYFTAILWAACQPKISDRNAGIVMVAALVFGTFGWVYTPVIVLALWVYYGRLHASAALTYERNRVLSWASLACAGVGAAAYALPRLLVALKGYTSTSSTWTYRAGLDGDTRYFQNVFQAILQPYCCEARTWTSLVPFIPLLVCAACVWGQTRTLRYRLVKQLVFLLAPYLFSLALFPQSVSIHPYLYDQLLFLPIALMGATWILAAPVQRRLRGPYLLAGLLLLATLVTTNFVAIAQAMQRPSRLNF